MSSDAFVSDQDSYLEDLDFNKIFSEKRAEIDSIATQKLQAMSALADYDEATLAQFKSLIINAETRKAAQTIDPNLVAKRPEIARRQMREILTKKAQDEVATLLSDLGIDEKASTLYPKFSRHLVGIQSTMPNDGILVRFINAKLVKKFGKVAERDTNALSRSIEHVEVVMAELRGMLK
jgi:DNA repair protein RadD